MDDQAREIAAYLYARSVAQEMLLRALWAELALQKPDPERFLFDCLEGMVASMDERRELEEAPVVELAQTELRVFFEQCSIRLAGLAARGQSA